MTRTDVRSIYRTTGAVHVEFCIEQFETQAGSKKAAPLKAELARLIARDGGR